jgi:myo-inositol-1(or 4)-monophosphatase
VFEELRKARPTYSFLMEEAGEVKGTDGQHRWIIDPLDGTTNFLHSIPIFAVALALERAGEIVASVIFNPVMDELFTAEKGTGAWLNDRRRLRVAARKHLAESVVCLGIKISGTDNDALTLRQLAMDLAWLSAGRFDGFWEAKLSPWDIAPGWLLLREAGGTMTDFAGTPGSIWNGEVVAGNEAVHGELLKLIKTIK